MSAENLPTLEEEELILDEYVRLRPNIELFCNSVRGFFERAPEFNISPLPLVHSVRSRMKDPEHLREKIQRKWGGGPIAPNNLLTRITDLAGVRVLHLHTAQFPAIHSLIARQLQEAHWFLHEPPKAYSWDPDARAVFERCEIHVESKESYTSVHYVVRPHAGSPLTCEIQVRTLFEEIWGEIDHVVNYPMPSGSAACREQLRVLARLASAGTRLADSIFITKEETEGHIKAR